MPGRGQGGERSPETCTLCQQNHHVPTLYPAGLRLGGQSKPSSPGEGAEPSPNDTCADCPHLKASRKQLGSHCAQPGSGAGEGDRGAAGWISSSSQPVTPGYHHTRGGTSGPCSAMIVCLESGEHQG